MPEAKFKPPAEWFKQAEYDLKTAEALFKTGRYIYTVFMCHLTIEKALKGTYAKKIKQNPPKTHDLNYLADKVALELPEKHRIFLEELNDLSVPTRYADELEKILKQYKKSNSELILKRTKELWQWLKKKG